MNDPKRKLWQTAAELFAMSILEICPKLVFKTIEAGFIGFSLEYLSPEQLQKTHLDLALTRVKEKAKKRVKIEVVEMVSRNVIEYLKHLKQPLRAELVDTREQFTKVVKIDDRYADLLIRELEEDLSLLQAIEIEPPELLGEAIIHKKSAPLYRIKGYAFSSSQELKQHKKMIREKEPFDHRHTSFEGEVIALWRSLLVNFADILREAGYKEKWRNEPTLPGEFAEVEEEIPQEAFFGLKSNGLFRGIQYIPFPGDKTIGQLLKKKIPLLSTKDIYGIDWEVLETKGEGRIWIDRIVALLIEEKNVSKKPFFSKVVTK